MSRKFEPAGDIRKEHAALALDLPGWQLGRLVIAAADVPKLLNGREVDVNFVQQRPGRDPFIGFAGTARRSKSGRAIVMTLDGARMTAPLDAIRAVNEGRRTAATLSKIIDADEQRGKPIDHDLVRSFA